MLLKISQISQKNTCAGVSLYVPCFNKVAGLQLCSFLRCIDLNHFFSIWVFFHECSRITGLLWKGEGIPSTPLYHFHPLHRQLDITWATTAESSPLHIASSRNVPLGVRYGGCFIMHCQRS